MWNGCRILPLLFLPVVSGQVGPPGPVKYSRQPDAAGVAYGPHERHVLDLWKAKSSRPTPLVVYFHPGGFTHGDKTWIESYDKPLLDLCLERGISVATANYRFTRHADLPASMEDGARAIQFLRLHAKEYNLNPKAVIAAGGSSGGIISMWVGFHNDMADPKSDDPVKRQSTRLCAIGSIDGQSTLDLPFLTALAGEKIVERLKLQFFKSGALNAENANRKFEEISAITYLTRDDPPVFAYYTHNLGPLPAPSDNETIHNPRFGVLLKERMDKLGIECIFRQPKDYPAGSPKRPFTKEMVDFFVAHFPRQ